MTNNSNRDLLVMFNEEIMSPQAIEHEVELLHQMLYGVEGIENLIIAHEVLDLNKYKIFNSAHQLRKNLYRRNFKPFVFLSCKN